MHNKKNTLGKNSSVAGNHVTNSLSDRLTFVITRYILNRICLSYPFNQILKAVGINLFEYSINLKSPKGNRIKKDIDNVHFFGQKN